MRFTNFFSLKSLAAIGFAIAVIPLALAVMSATAAVRETAALGRGMNCQVFEQTKTVRLALQKTSDIERKARLFVLLADTPLRRPYERKAYETARASFKQALGELQKLGVDGKIALLASELSEKEGLIYRQIIQSETESHPSLPVEEAFIGLREASNTLSREFEGYVDHQFDELRGQSESLGRELLTQCVLLLGVFVAWVGLLMASLARPMRQLDASIRKLGDGNFAEPIKIAGTSDLRHLGDCLEWLRMRLLEREAPNQPHMENAVDANATGTPSTHPPSQAMAEDKANELALLPNEGLSQQRQDTPHGRIDPKPQKPPAPREINRQGANFQNQLPLADEA
jgi:two-component system sensor histidine kinase GlrK